MEVNVDKGKKNLMYHILNNQPHNTIDDGVKRYSLKEIFTFIAEFIACALLFAMFIFFISISDGFDQHIIEWMGR